MRQRVTDPGDNAAKPQPTDNSRSAIHARSAFCDTSSSAQRRRILMDDLERDGNGGDDDEQFEQMIVENSILLHSLAALLVRKGLIKQDEIDAEMDKLYDEMEKFDGE
jgi:hypothetical protein